MAPKKRPDPAREIDPHAEAEAPAQERDRPSETPTEAAYSGDPATALEEIETAEPGEESTIGGGADARDDGGADPELRNVTPPEGALPFEEWYEEIWCGAHMAVNIPLRTQSLAAAPKTPEGRRAALALYRTCCRVPVLHIVVRPGPEWLRDLGVFAAYSYFLGAGIAAELADRKAAAERARAQKASAGSGSGKTAEGEPYGFAGDA